jgi:hypothetical protein
MGLAGGRAGEAGCMREIVFEAETEAGHCNGEAGIVVELRLCRTG